MNQQEIIEQLQEIANVVFKETGLTLQLHTQLNEIRSWNSLTHIMFVDSIERKFGISFSFEDMLQLTTVEDFCTKIEQNLAK